MKIYKKTSDQQAERNSDGLFVCGLKKRNNEDSRYEHFREIEEAAAWLLKNPEWGIRMNPGWSLVHRDIVIDRDG